MCLIWVVEKVNVFDSEFSSLFIEMILGGDQLKWDIGRVKFVTFSG